MEGVEWEIWDGAVPELSRGTLPKGCALPGGLCRHGHPSDGKELLESGLLGRQGVPTACRGPGSTFHHPETPCSFSASSAELGTCLFAKQPA